MSVSRTAFTRIHRDALPTVKRRASERKRENAHTRSHTTHCLAPRYGPRPVPAMHFTSHIGRRPVEWGGGRARARLVARSPQRRDTQIGRALGKKGKRERGRAACLAACPFSLPSFSPSAFPRFRLASCLCLHSLPSQLYMRGETHCMSSKKS